MKELEEFKLLTNKNESMSNKNGNCIFYFVCFFVFFFFLYAMHSNWLISSKIDAGHLVGKTKLNIWTITKKKRDGIDEWMEMKKILSQKCLKFRSSLSNENAMALFWMWLFRNVAFFYFLSQSKCVSIVFISLFCNFKEDEC